MQNSLSNMISKTASGTSGDGHELSGQHIGLLLLKDTEKGSFHTDPDGNLMKRCG